MFKDKLAYHDFNTNDSKCRAILDITIKQKFTLRKISWLISWFVEKKTVEEPKRSR